MSQLAGFMAALAMTAGSFLFGYFAGSYESGNFNDDVILDPSQVIIRPLTGFAR